MAKTLPTIRGLVRQALRNEDIGDYEWENDELDLQIGQVVEEVSLARPDEVTEGLVTTQKSKALDVSGITSLIAVDRIEYPVGGNPRNYRNFDKFGDTLVMDIDAIPASSESGTLTGTVTFTQGSTAVTGSGTLFTTELTADYCIKMSTGTDWHRISSIASATALTLSEGSLRDDGADAADSTLYGYELVFLDCLKMHSLTDSSSTLPPYAEHIIVLGAVAYAALAKSQEDINAVNIGGRNVASELRNWGLTKLTLYRQELAKITKPRTYREYPRT